MGQPKSILIVEDEVDLAETIRFNLEREGYGCQTATDGAAALEAIRKERPDLIILDRMLPTLSGDDVIKELKRVRHTTDLPVIMLTAKTEESDQLVGFALGADDYINKPFSMKLLLARVAAVLHRTEPLLPDSEILRAGPISLDVERHEVAVDGRPVFVTATEFKLLKALVVAEGRVLSRAQLIDAVMGIGVAVTDRTIDVHITSLRKKLDHGAVWIQTIRGIGYTVRNPD